MQAERKERGYPSPGRKDEGGRQARQQREVTEGEGQRQGERLSGTVRICYKPEPDGRARKGPAWQHDQPLAPQCPGSGGNMGKRGGSCGYSCPSGDLAPYPHPQTLKLYVICRPPWTGPVSEGGRGSQVR